MPTEPKNPLQSNDNDEGDTISHSNSTFGKNNFFNNDDTRSHVNTTTQTSDTSTSTTGPEEDNESKEYTLNNHDTPGGNNNVTPISETSSQLSFYVSPESEPKSIEEKLAKFYTENSGKADKGNHASLLTEFKNIIGEEQLPKKLLAKYKTKSDFSKEEQVITDILNHLTPRAVATLFTQKQIVDKTEFNETTFFDLVKQVENNSNTAYGSYDPNDLEAMEASIKAFYAFKGSQENLESEDDTIDYAQKTTEHTKATRLQQIKADGILAKSMHAFFKNNENKEPDIQILAEKALNKVTGAREEKVEEEEEDTRINNLSSIKYGSV